MKARYENGQIKEYPVLPRIFKGVTGTYPGGFHLMPTEIHEAEGFYDVVVPEINSTTQQLGAIYWDEENNVFTYPVSDKVFDLEGLKEQRKSELRAVMKEFATLASMARLIYGNDYAGLETVIGHANTVRQQTLDRIAEIDNVPDMLKFQIRPEDVEQMREMFEPFTT